METRLGDLLRDARLLTDAQLGEAIAEHRRTGVRLGSTLVAMGFIDENLLVTFLSMQTGVPCVSLQNVIPSHAVLSVVPKALARRRRAIPLKRIGDTLHVAMADPTDTPAIEDLAASSGLRIVPLIAPESAIVRSLGAYYPGRGRPRAATADLTHGRADVTAEIETMERSLRVLAGSLRRLRRRLARPPVAS